MRNIKTIISSKIARPKFIKVLLQSKLSMMPQTDCEEAAVATQQLIDLSHNATSYIELALLLIELMSIQDMMSIAFIIHFIEITALPEASQLNILGERMISKIKNAKTKQELEQTKCISAIIWSVLAEKQAGKVGEKLFTDSVYKTLKTIALDTTCLRSMMLSIIALESFALTAPNKVKLLEKGYLDSLKNIKLSLIGQDVHLSREITFCLDKSISTFQEYDAIKNPPDTKNIFSILNCTVDWRVSASFWKFSPDFLEVRNDRAGFASARGTTCITDEKWFYEVELLTPGVMQIGWATKLAFFDSEEGIGVGDEVHSFGYDGCRNLFWYKGDSSPYGDEPWKVGDFIGVYFDVDNGTMSYYVNGKDLGVCFKFDEEERNQHLVDEEGFFPAFSFTSYQHAIINFGHRPFQYPPTQIHNLLNDYGRLTEDLKLGPAYAKAALLQPTATDDDVELCTICYLNPGDLLMIPCRHDEVCLECISRMVQCPFCRSEVSTWQKKPGTKLPEKHILASHRD